MNFPLFFFLFVFPPRVLRLPPIQSKRNPNLCVFLFLSPGIEDWNSNGSASAWRRSCLPLHLRRGKPAIQFFRVFMHYHRIHIFGVMHDFSNKEISFDSDLSFILHVLSHDLDANLEKHKGTIFVDFLSFLLEISSRSSSLLFV